MTEKIFTVAELSKLVSDQLKALGRFWIEAEINSFKHHISRHWYFDIKDEKNDAVLKCCMFSNANRQMNWRPKVGDKVKLSGQLNLHRGSLNLVVYRMQRAGLGAKELQLQELRKKLLAEGLFEASRKKPLPRFPKRIGVATSRTSAALRDILEVLRSRMPSLIVYVVHCTTEGASAAKDIVRAVQLLNDHGQSDVIIVGRGGGAKDSLSAFNEEILIRAIAASTIPIVCAVGHETDNTLCDLVADHRAATPTHAAELVTSITQSQLLDQLKQRKEMLARRMLREIRGHQAILKQIQPRDPFSRITEGRLRLKALEKQMQHQMQAIFKTQHQRIRQRGVQLGALDPNAVLGRGYSVTLHNGKSVTDVRNLRKGATVTIQFETGKVSAKITKVIAPGDFEQLPLLIRNED